ncbi:high-affinity nickel transporter nic1 [Nannizzia gypsea CBS 118893]|uniref:Nickel/cobalt efflux system n=1 Tax=Arthroderma gypseum (strain ATCC MYA-4604 / CBS 118893) TaxID=535722 RepID=E4UPZ5_ARTGP|nr:high-affinity nickel transporter nic1 [Nannizzia gypsea CBS 118893]EFQ99129.1 high-affinity nickel transporter nic1 [Nannizzia gypsea CBS 118893]
MLSTGSTEQQLLAADGDVKPRWSFIEKAERSHRRIPGLRKIPLPALAIILFVALINILVWVAAGIVLLLTPTIDSHRFLASTAALAYSLGLRHALDADHISAIDLMTRRLLATGQKAVTVGTFFSLGHSTIVIITSIVVAATAAAVSDKFDRYGSIGGIIGSSVSSAFLILLGVMNGYILYKLILQMKKVLRDKNRGEEMWKIEGGGILFSILKGMFKIIDRPWKMYPLGVLFGLGFDTSSEVALLGISSIQGSKGTSIWLILILPILFTSGMCLVDTIDGALMLSLYVQPAAHFLDSKSTSSAAESDTPILQEVVEQQPAPAEESISRNPRDPVAFLYYSIVLTSLTVIVAIVIGVIQLLTLLLNALKPEGKFWDGVQVAGDYYDVIGGAICGLFIIVGGISVLVYPQWRRWAEKNQASLPSDDSHVRAQADEESRIGDLGDAANTRGQSLYQADEIPAEISTTRTAADTKLV